MGKKNEFVIPFVGLNPGEHHYEFTIGDAFFDELEYSEIKKGNVTVKMLLNKQSTMMILDFDLKGVVEVPCDRCADDFRQPVEAHPQLIVKLGAEEFNDEDEIITLPSSEYEFDVSHYIYEYIVLSLPARRLHADDAEGVSGCDPEVLKKLEEVNTHEEPKEEEIDPRWDALKKLKKK